MTQEQVLATIQKIANRLCSKYKFGYYDIDDLKQETFLAAVEALEKYDGIRPLENFLQVALKRKLINLKRNKYQRIEKPCLKCPLYNKNVESECDKYTDKQECNLYKNWYKRNQDKKNLVEPICFENVDDESEQTMRYTDSILSNLSEAEVLETLEANLPADLRKDFIKLRFGAKLSRYHRAKIQEAIFQILEEKGLIDNE